MPEDPVKCPDMDAFVAEVRKAVKDDGDAIVESPDGWEVSAVEFLKEWDRMKAAEKAGLN